MPGILDTRVVNLKPNNLSEITANINLHVNASALMGCDVTNTAASDFIQKKVFSYNFPMKNFLEIFS